MYLVEAFKCRVACVRQEVDTSLILRTDASPETLNGYFRWELGLEYCLGGLEVLTFAGRTGGQSVLLIIVCSSFMHTVTCHAPLSSFLVHLSYVLIVVGWRRKVERVDCFPLYTCARTL